MKTRILTAMRTRPLRRSAPIEKAQSSKFCICEAQSTPFLESEKAPAQWFKKYLTHEEQMLLSIPALIVGNPLHAFHSNCPEATALFIPILSSCE
jgi:hypothetical protein